MRHARRLVLLLAVLVVQYSHSASQTDRTHSGRDSTITSHSSDSLHHLPIAPSSSLADTAPYRPAKKPWLAVGLSAAIPGLGQLYNEQYWKPPIIIGLGAYWISEWIKLNRNYSQYRDLYLSSITPIRPSGNNQFLQYRDFYRDERDKFAWYLGALYVLNLLDAYVGANLYDFNVDADLGADGRMVPRVSATARLRL